MWSDVQNLRRLAAALAVGATAALVIDLLLRNALSAAQSPVASSLTPWWVVGRVSERGVWVVFAVLVWSIAGLIGRTRPRRTGDAIAPAAAFGVTGRLMLILPPLWALATLFVSIVQITLAGDWGIDGEMFVSISLYNSLLLGYLPWAGSGVILLVLSRHMSE